MESTIEGTLKHALFISRHLNQCSPKCLVVVVLLELGVPTKRIGFDYIKHSVLLFHHNPTQTITKGIYPAVGTLYDPPISIFQVEQAIRSAINEAWRNRDERVWTLYFQPDRDGALKKPSNAEFISRIARFIELCQGCCKEVCYE